MSTPNPVTELLDRYRAAVQGKDVEAFVAVYDDNVRVFDMWARWAYTGLDEWRQMAEDWFGSIGDDRVEVEFQEVRSLASADIAVVHAFVTFRGLSPTGEELRAMDNRLTWTLRTTDEGAWKVIHEHTSAPIDSETTTAKLNR